MWPAECAIACNELLHRLQYNIPTLGWQQVREELVRVAAAAMTDWRETVIGCSRVA